MGTLFQDIFSLGGTVSARKEANKQAERAEQQYGQSQQQQADYLSQLRPFMQGSQERQQQAYSEALNDRNSARNLYNNIGAMGLSDRENAMRSFYDLLPLYTGVTGLNTQGSGLYYAPTTAAQPSGGTSLSPGPPSAYNRTPQSDNAGTAAQALNNRTRPPQSGEGSFDLRAWGEQNANRAIDPRVTMGPFGPGGAPATVGEYMGITPPSSTSAPNFDPYALTADQQVQLNQQVDVVNRQKQSALSELEARFAQRGITDPRAMEVARQQILDQYDSQSSGLQANFGETARANRERAVSTLLDLFNGMQQQGMASMGTNAQALLALANAAQGSSDTQQQALLSAISQLGNLSGNNASMANNLFGNASNAALGANQMGQDAISGALGLLGYGLSGGFDKPKKPKGTGNT